LRRLPTWCQRLLTWRVSGAEPDIGALVVLFERPSGDCDRTDDDTAAPEEPSSPARHDGCSRYVNYLREHRGVRLLKTQQVTAVLMKQRNAGCFRRGDTSRHRRRIVHAIENLQVPAAVDDCDRDFRAKLGGVFAHPDADGPSFVQSE